MWPSSQGSTFKFDLLRAGLACCFASSVLAQTDNDGLAPTPAPGPFFFNTADLAVTTAEEVVMDVQSVLFSSRFQQGEIDGFRYVLFPDGSARIYDKRDRQNVIARMQCRSSVSCQINTDDGPHFEVLATGAPKPDLIAMTDARDVATYLAEWVLAGTGSAPVEVVQTSIADAETSQTEALVPVVLNEAEAIVEVAVAVEIEEQSELESDEAVLILASADIEVQPDNSETQDQNHDEGQDIARLQDVDCSEQGQFVLTACADPTPVNDRPLPPVVRDVPAVPSPISQPVPAIEVNEPEQLSFSEKYKLKCSLTGSANLNYENPEGQIQRPGKPRVSLGCSASPTEKLSMRIALIGYVFSEQQEDFNPDFTYAFTYRINNTVSLGYSNYAGRFSGEDSGVYNALIDGNFRASLRLPKLTLPNDKSIACSTSFGLPNPMDVSANLSCGYSVTPKLRVGATMLLYLPDVQEDFQPDFTYTASYRWDENWLFSYSNYSNNRWPWNPPEGSGGGFDAGSVSVTYSLTF